jgi:hypothetical protein
MGASQDVEPIEQSLIRLQGARKRLHSSRGHRDVPFRAAASLRGGIAHSGREEAFGFETFQGGVEGARRNSASRAFHELGANGDAVGVVAQPQNRQKNELFKLA